MRLVATAAALLALALPATAEASFGFLPGPAGFDAATLKPNGAPENRAGIHPDSLEIHLERTMSGQFGDGDLRDLHLELPAGLLVNPTPAIIPSALSRLASCTAEEFRTPRASPFESSLSGESCPDASQIGVVAVRSSYGGGTTRHFGVFNVDPPYGSPLALGFAPYGVPIVFTAHVREADAGLTLDLEDLSQALDFQAFDLTIWGTPWAHSHDALRGNCLAEPTGGSHGSCEVPGFPTPKSLEEATKSLLTLPTSCEGPMRWRLLARSWQGESVTAEVIGHDEKGDPLPLVECKNGLTKAHMRLTTDRAGIGSGLVFDLDVNDGGGILNPGGIARPSIRTARIELPEGLTLNPSLGNGLGVCTEAEFAREAVDTSPGAGCPNASKVGTVVVDGMMGQAQSLSGSLYIATPYDNPFGTLLAVYIIARAPERGLFVRATGRVDLDPGSGRMTMTFQDLPKLLYTHFGLSFRTGQRPAFVSPPTCGAYTMAMDLRAWGRPNVLLQDSDAFTIAASGAGASCLAGAVPRFAPIARSGSVTPQAGAQSPLFLNLARADADQEITSYSTQLPPGLLGRIAGVPFCSDAAIEAARARTGAEELRNPSCPAASAIGRTLSGYGVGAILAYAPGSLYLAGPYRGAPLSVVAVDSALIGPFDLGTVIVRSAIRVDPRTAQVTIDASASDPIPHILSGVPLHLRDIRVYIDRSDFMVNPTSCERFSVASNLTGSAVPFANPRAAFATVTVPYQAFNCGSLGFAPRIALKLIGPVKRGGYPTLQAVVTPRRGDAGIARAAVSLPSSLFLDQGNIRRICTREQWAAEACPPQATIGFAKAETPLLDEPMEGPVYLRSSSSKLPDLAVALSGRGIRVELAGRVDSHRGGLRASFGGLPDAPLTRFTMTLFGGRKRGLLVATGGLCSRRQLATARFLGQANLGREWQPRIGFKCGKRAGGKARGKAGAR